MLQPGDGEDARIYQSLASLHAGLSSELRGVMDRMLASDQAIAEARAAQQAGPLFKEAPPGMSEQDWQTYVRIVRRGKEAAEAGLLKRTMEAIRREKTKWWKEERAATRVAVEKEFSARRDFRLIELLANRRWLGEGEGEIPDIRIDRADLVRMFGEGVLADLTRQKPGGKRLIHAEGGLAPVRRFAAGPAAVPNGQWPMRRRVRRPDANPAGSSPCRAGEGSRCPGAVAPAPPAAWKSRAGRSSPAVFRGLGYSCADEDRERGPP